MKAMMKDDQKKECPLIGFPTTTQPASLMHLFVLF
jgi:hypothetical protein